MLQGVQTTERITGADQRLVQAHEVTLHKTNLIVTRDLKWSNIEDLNLPVARHMGDKTFNAASNVNVSSRVCLFDKGSYQ